MILGNQNIKQLLFKLSVPATVGMVVMALYNVVDAIFIGRGVGAIGIAGVAIAFPIQMIVGAVGQMLGIGGASVLSRSLGAKDYDKAGKTLGNVIASVAALSLVITVVGYVFMQELLLLFGASESILPYAREYLQYILAGVFMHSLAMALNNLVRAEGKAKVAMITMVLSAVINIILDAIFILGFKMGIRGAAIATLIAYIVSAVFLLAFYLSGKSFLRLSISDIRFDRSIQQEIFSIGVPSFIQQAAMSLLIIVLNNTLGKLGGDISIAVYGVVLRLIMLVFTPIIGLAQGLQPIVGYNYGANNYAKTKEAVKLAIIAATFVSTAGALVLFIFPKVLLSVFSDDPELIAGGIYALRLIVLAFPLVGFQVMGTTLFQAIGKAKQTFILTLSRQFLFLLPMVFTLPHFFNVTGVWISYPIADVFSAVLTYVMLYNLQNRYKYKIGLESEYAI
jgi:putative MATE family efflux protein